MLSLVPLAQPGIDIHVYRRQVSARIAKARVLCREYEAENDFGTCAKLDLLTVELLGSLAWADRVLAGHV